MRAVTTTRVILRRVTLLVVLSLPAAAVASIPPPPVNQQIGIPDVRFKDMTFATCLKCHGDPDKAAAPVKKGYLPDRHHLRVDTPIGDYSASPYPERSPDGTHKCVTCHEMEWRNDPEHPDGGALRLVLDDSFRDCLNGCHVQKKNSLGRLVASVHHLTADAQRAACHNCHGSLVDDPNGDHRIPDPLNHPDDPQNHYDFSLTTPWPGVVFSQSKVQLRWALQAYYSSRLELPRHPTPEQLHAKQETEELIDYIVQNLNPPVGETGRRMGNCSYCHHAGTDDLTGLLINGNYANHHGTGVGQPGTGSVHTCTLCHQPSAPPSYTIRGCQRCHGIDSLHNIEYDANGDGVVFGEEAPFYGHIGNQKNCDGCHRNYRGDTSAASISDGVGGDFLVPVISWIETATITAGYEKSLAITGSGFTDGDTSTWVRLNGLDGISHDIHPNTLSSSRIEVTLGADLPPGSYRLVVVKQRGTDERLVTSTAVNFLITPQPEIESASCDDNTITITGSGFGSYLDAQDSGTGVTGNGSLCYIESWSEQRIVAECSSGSGGPLRVDGLFGSVSTTISCDNGRPRWWSIWSWWSSWSWSRR